MLQNQELTRANAMVSAIVVALERKGILTPEEVIGVRNITDAATLLVEKKVLDPEEVNVLVINYRSFVELVGRILKSSPEERGELVATLDRRFGKKFPKHVKLVKELMDGKDS